jgi:hypothetical protein
MNVGIALIVIGLGNQSIHAVGRTTIRTYRAIRSKEFLKGQDAFKMYKGTEPLTQVASTPI